MWQRILAIVACLAAVNGGLVKIRVDDEVKVYLDGEVVHDEFAMRSWQWSKLAEIPFSANASIMAFRMYNQGPRRLGYGKGEIDGKDLFSSGIVCKDVPKKQDPDAFFPGWFEADYDDSDWKHPVAVVSHPTEGILADAQGFWGGPRSSKTVLCRLKLRVAATWEYSVVCPPANFGDDTNSRCDIILLAGDEPATVNITTVNSTQSVTVESKKRWTAENLQLDGGLENKAILISSDVQISVNLAYVDVEFTPQEFNDATGIASVSSAQTSFYIINHVNATDTCRPGVPNEFFAISSSEDNTIVTITSQNGSEFVSLNRYDTFSQLEEGTISLSGYKINSSSPVTVVAGSLCTSNDDYENLGTIITSPRPVDKYNTHYIVPSIKANQSAGYDVHVVAFVDNTLVNIDGQESNLDEGEIVVQVFASRTNVTTVTCSHPCNVVQFSKSYTDADGLFGIDVIPTNEFYTRAIFTTSDEENWDHHITVVVDSSTAVNDIQLDGALFDPEWSSAGDYIYATADVEQGYHVMNSTESRFAVYVYAHVRNLAGGYGFAVLPAGDL